VPSLRYSFASDAEIRETARLISHSFPGPTRTLPWLEAQLRSPVYGGGPETLLVGRGAAGVVAACQVHPLQQWVAGQLLPCSGVGTVAISPAHRRQRLGAELVTAALRASLERGDVLSALYPFRTPFYQKLGYGVTGEVLQYQVPPQTLPDAPERLQVELLDSDSARAEALALYGRWARGQTGQIERSERLWASLTVEHDRALAGFRNAAGFLEGYALLVYRADLPRQERYLEVDELIWTTPQARRGLYAWIASLSDQWEQVLLRALPSHRLGDWISEPRLPPGAAPLWRLWAPAAVLQLGTMSRILDLRRAWEQRRVAAGHQFSVAIEVQDAQLAANAGSWRLTFEGGRTLVDTGAAHATLRLDVSTLSRLYMSAMTPTAAREAGLLDCDRPELLPALDATLALPEPWTFDRF
jgi:predicted acetyltransferase